MKKIINSSLAAVLAFNIVGSSAFAGPQEDARAYVASSQEAARVHAENLLFQYIKDTAVGLGNQASGTPEFNAMLADIKKREESIKLLANKFVQKKDPTGFQSSQELSQELNGLYVQVRAQERIRDRLILENQAIVSDLRGGVSYVQNSIIQVCSEGIASNINYPELPSVKPIPPVYSFYLSGGYSGGDFKVNAPEFQMSGENTEWVAPVSVASAAVGSAVYATLTTNVTFTAALGGAGVGPAAMAAGLGVGAAVALVAYAYSMDKAISESKKVSDAKWIVFEGTANAESVRSEFKKICEPMVTRLVGLNEKINLLNSNNPEALAEYEDSKIQVKNMMAALKEVSSAVHKKEQDLTTLAKEQPEDKREAWIDSELRKSDERKAYTDFMASLDKNIFFDMLEISLIELSQQSDVLTKELSPFYEKLYSSSVKKYNKELNVLIETVRKLSFKPQTIEALNEEISLYKELGSAFREFDASFAQYLSELYRLGQTVESRARLLKWKSAADKLIVKYPASTSAKVLKVQAEQVIKILGI